MYLRYLRDIRPWHPHLVILALSSDAAGRSMGVYGFNIFSVFVPWAQPRFHIENGKLKPVNLPLPTHQEIASSQAASELPFLDYDWYFNPAEWDLPHWRCLYRSYLFRLYTTWYPLWRLHPNTNRDSLESLNHHLLRSFVETATAERTAAVVIYLPDKVDYQDPGRRETTSLRVLRSSGMEYYDLVPCLEPIAPGNRFLPHGIHYSPVAGVAIARCLHPTIAKKLPAQKTST
jgi:hypothetical protein